MVPYRYLFRRQRLSLGSFPAKPGNKLDNQSHYLRGVRSREIVEAERVRGVTIQALHSPQRMQPVVWRHAG
jgi:hypothetical protein